MKKIVKISNIFIKLYRIINNNISNSLIFNNNNNNNNNKYKIRIINKIL